jgi:probable rRNA maturation factor
MPVSFHYADVDFKLKSLSSVKKFIGENFLKSTQKNISLSVVFCSDDYLLNINKQFLNHDYYTDIITFPLAETTKRVTAEIYISLERVWDNAKKQQTTFDDELHRVLFHGVLHLTGLGDKTKVQKDAMRAAEDKWLAAYAKYLKASV